jgi:hypothetical protein
VVELVLADVPVQVEKAIWSWVGPDFDNALEQAEEVESQVSILNLVKIAFVGHFHVHDEFKTVAALEQPVDDADWATDDGQKGRIISIFDALVNHKESWAITEHMPDKDEVPSPIEAVVGPQHLIDEGWVFGWNVRLNLQLLDVGVDAFACFRFGDVRH